MVDELPREWKRIQFWGAGRGRDCCGRRSFTEEGRLKLGLKDVQDLAGPQKGMTDGGRAPGKGLEPQESTRIKLEVKASCNSDASRLQAKPLQLRFPNQNVGLSNRERNVDLC